MASQQEFQAVLDRIDTATSNIAAQLQSLKNQIAGQGLPPEIELEVLNKLTTAAEKLEGIGKTDTGEIGGEEAGGTVIP